MNLINGSYISISNFDVQSQMPRQEAGIPSLISLDMDGFNVFVKILDYLDCKYGVESQKKKGDARIRRTSDVD